MQTTGNLGNAVVSGTIGLLVLGFAPSLFFKAAGVLEEHTTFMSMQARMAAGFMLGFLVALYPWRRR